MNEKVENVRTFNNAPKNGLVALRRKNAQICRDIQKEYMQLLLEEKDADNSVLEYLSDEEMPPLECSSCFKLENQCMCDSAAS